MTSPRSDPAWSAGLSGSTALIRTPLPLARPRASARSAVKSCNCSPKSRSALAEPVASLSVAPGFGAGCFSAILLNCSTLSLTTVGGNGEAEALSRNALRSEGHLGRADPDEAAGEIDERAAAVPGLIAASVCSRFLVIVVVDGDIALHAAENAPADRAAVAERRCRPR